MKNEPFVIEKTYNAPVERVWKAITDKDQMKQWYFDLEKFKPEVGFEFQFTGGTEDKSYLHLCKITEVVANRKLTYSWRYDGYEGNSFVTFELFAEGDQTRVKLTHVGLETFPMNNPDFARKSFEAGWSEIIGLMLKEFVEKVILKKSIEINAPASKVWDILVNPVYTMQWGNAFSEGTFVETDWKKGSEVLWKDKGGNIGAKGIVVENNPASLLKVGFYEDVNANPPTSLGKYAETYSFLEKDGKTILSFEAGPLSEKEFNSHSPLWDKAISKMQEIAENKVASLSTNP